MELGHARTYEFSAGSQILDYIAKMTKVFGNVGEAHKRGGDHS